MATVKLKGPELLNINLTQVKTLEELVKAFETLLRTLREFRVEYKEDEA